MIILDDLMEETDQRVASLFTKKSHHRNISVMYIVQNLFHHRTISLNAHYMVVFKNPRDVSQIMALAHQMYPQRTKYFLEAYTAATAQPDCLCSSTVALYFVSMKELTLMNRYHQTQGRPKHPIRRKEHRDLANDKSPSPIGPYFPKTPRNRRKEVKNWVDF